MTEFAPYLKNNSSFVVRNITSDRKKIIRIFQYPIYYNQTRDLLQIPGVGEAEIRASLLKGELKRRLLAKDIKIDFSDIDLLQFNDEQKLFLQSNGVDVGLELETNNNNIPPVIPGTGITNTQHQILQQLIHFIDEGPATGFASNAYKEILGQPFPSNITWYVNNSKAKKIVEKILTRDNFQNPINIVWNMYESDGTTIVASITDNISYTSNILESNRTRIIS